MMFQDPFMLLLFTNIRNIFPFSFGFSTQRVLWSVCNFSKSTIDVNKDFIQDKGKYKDIQNIGQKRNHKHSSVLVVFGIFPESENYQAFWL